MKSRRVKLITGLLAVAIVLSMPGLLGCGGDEAPMAELTVSERNLFPADQFSAEQLEALDKAYAELSEEDKALVDEKLSLSAGCNACCVGLLTVAISLSVAGVGAIAVLAAGDGLVEAVVWALDQLGYHKTAKQVVDWLHKTLVPAMKKGLDSVWDISQFVCNWVGACPKP